MPRKTLSNDAVMARRAEVGRLYCEGWPQHRIAERFQLSQSQISRDLDRCREEWQRAMVRAFDRYKAEQLAKIDAIEKAAWKGWRRSLRPAEKRSAEVINDSDGERKKSSKTEEGQAGDPAFLAVMHKCIERRCKILGLDAVPNTPPSIVPITVIRFDSMPALDPITVDTGPPNGAITVRVDSPEETNGHAGPGEV